MIVLTIEIHGLPDTARPHVARLAADLSRQVGADNVKVSIEEEACNSETLPTRPPSTL